MNKTEITNHIAEVLGDRKQAKALIDSMLVQISAALQKGEIVTPSGFGTLKRVQRQAA